MQRNAKMARRAVAILFLVPMAASCLVCSLYAQPPAMEPAAPAPVHDPVFRVTSPNSTLVLVEKFAKVVELPNIKAVDGFDPEIVKVEALAPNQVRVLGNKQVALGPLAVEAGIFAFLLLVVTSSAVAELHGRDTAKRLVLFGFVPLIVSVLLSLVVLEVPPSPDMDPLRLQAFDTMMSGTPRIWIGGITAYGVSTFLNVTIFSRLKAREGSRLLWLRAAIASVLSQIVDTLIFITVAFYGVFPIAELILGQMLAKVVLSAVLVPPLVYAFVGLGRALDRPAKDSAAAP